MAVSLGTIFVLNSIRPAHFSADRKRPPSFAIAIRTVGRTGNPRHKFRRRRRHKVRLPGPGNRHHRKTCPRPVDRSARTGHGGHQTQPLPEPSREWGQPPRPQLPWFIAFFVLATILNTYFPRLRASRQVALHPRTTRPHRNIVPHRQRNLPRYAEGGGGGGRFFSECCCGWAWASLRCTSFAWGSLPSNSTEFRDTTQMVVFVAQHGRRLAERAPGYYTHAAGHSNGGENESSH